MKKDIEIPEVKGIYIAAINEKNDHGELVWNIYLINDKDHMVEGALITSKGYDITNGVIQNKTAQMRHVVGNIPTKSGAFVELIDSQVFEIYNEFWVTFFEHGKLMEKKFTFGPHTIDSNFCELLPVLSKKEFWCHKGNLSTNTLFPFGVVLYISNL